MKIKAFYITLLILLSCSASFAVEIVLITDRDNPVSEISAQDAKNIFLGKKKSWDDGSMIIAVTQQERRVTEEFTRSIVKKSSEQFVLYWREVIFTGNGLPPLHGDDDDAMKEMVASKLGSVGYISAEAFDDTVKKMDVR